MLCNLLGYNLHNNKIYLIVHADVMRKSDIISVLRECQILGKSELPKLFSFLLILTLALSFICGTFLLKYLIQFFLVLFQI